MRAQRRRAWGLLGLLAGAAVPAAAAELRFERAWFRIEMIAFDRSDAGVIPSTEETGSLSASADAPGGESLLLTGPRQFPRNALAFDDAERRSTYYPLDADTLSAPTLPPVDPAYLATIGIDTRLTTREPAVTEPSAANVPATVADESIGAPAMPSPEAELAEATTRFEADLGARCYRWLDPTDLMLGNEARRIARAGGYRLLHHGAWIQPVPAREAPIPMLLQIGEREGDVWTVEGTLAVTLARYLHVHARLWHRADPGAEGEPGDVRGYYTLDEQRRLRTGELHYLDHPRFGLLIRIDPVEPPEALRALAEATP